MKKIRLYVMLMASVVLAACSLFIKTDKDESVSVQQDFIGEYTDATDGSTLQIGKNSDSGLGVKIGLFRLTDIDDGIGSISDGALTFTATDAAGIPIKGKITLEGDTATLVFTESTWEYLPDGSTYRFRRDVRAVPE